MQRRTFLKTTSTIAAAGLVSTLARPLLAFPQDSKYLDTIGLQLWTVRNQMDKDQPGTLKAIAEAGYKQVELRDVNDAVAQLPLCKDAGLNVTSAFLTWEAVCKPGPGVQTLEDIVQKSSDAELKHLVFGYIGKGSRETADQFKQHAETANKLGEMCKSAGIQLCYHNHSFEFAKIDGDKTGFELFMEGFDKDLCKFELDVFWAQIGGWDALETLQKLDGRVSQVHLKDLKKGTAVNHDEGTVAPEAFQPLGAGEIDMAKVLEISAKIGVEQCHVEQDESPNPITAIGESMKHLGTIS